MGVFRVEFLKYQAVIADKCLVADCFFDRLRGLMGKRGLDPGQAMLFPKCNSIHMWFMRFKIDVIFLAKHKKSDGTFVLKVSSVYSGVRPWKILPLSDWSATEVLELPEGSVKKWAIEAGDDLCIS